MYIVITVRSVFVILINFSLLNDKYFKNLSVY